MIALDTNILVYLLVRSQPEHARAKGWLEGNRERLATTHTNIAELLRLLTHPRVFPRPMDLKDAVSLLGAFVQEYEVAILEDQADWWQAIAELLKHHAGLRGNEVFDARIALCLRYHGVKELRTLDSDFVKYPFLKIVGI